MKFLLLALWLVLFLPDFVQADEQIKSPSAAVCGFSGYVTSDNLTITQYQSMSPSATLCPAPDGGPAWSSTYTLGNCQYTSWSCSRSYNLSNYCTTGYWNTTTKSCGVAPPPCPSAGTVVEGTITAAASPASVCFNGCAATVQSASNQYAVNGQQVIAGTWTYNGGGTQGGSCSGATATAGAPVNPTTCPAGKCMGTFNGQFLCLACSQAATPATITTKSSTSSNAGAGTTTTDTTKQTTVGPSGVTTTTTTVSINPSGVQTTQTMTEKKTQDEFCSTNPTAAICKGWEDPCQKNPELASCKELGTPSSSDTLGTSSADSGLITPVAIGTSGSCPADVPLPKGAVFSWAPVCTTANALRPIILALAWLSAGLILIGGFRNG